MEKVLNLVAVAGAYSRPLAFRLALLRSSSMHVPLPHISGTPSDPTRHNCKPMEWVLPEHSKRKGILDRIMCAVTGFFRDFVRTLKNRRYSRQGRPRPKTAKP